MARREWIWRLGGGLGALVCLGGLSLVSHQLWLGLTTGRIKSKYGWLLREDRPVTFDITLALNGLAAVLWIGLGVLALWVAFSRFPDEG